MSKPIDNEAEEVLKQDQERERVLLKWTTDQCGDNSGSIDFVEGWNMIKEHGLDILSKMLRGFLLKKNGESVQDRKPFGLKGMASLYTISYKMVNCNSSVTKTDPAKDFYERICGFIKEHLNSADIKATLSKKSALNLKEFISVWQSYKIMTKWIYYLFMHLESGVIKLNELLTLTSVSLVSFNEVIYKKFGEDQTAMTLGCIFREREGELIDIELMQESLQIYSMMGVASKIGTTITPEMRAKLNNIDNALKLQDFKQVYETDFEKAFLSESKEYYVKKSREWVNGCNVETYITLIDDVLAKEEKRVLSYLNPITRPKIIRVCLEECVFTHRDQLFESLKDMLRGIYDNTQTAENFTVPEDKAMIIRQMYQLCQRTQAMEKEATEYHLATRMCQVFKQYITELGDKIVDDRKTEILRMSEDAKNNKSSPEASASDPAMIESILRLFKYMPYMVKHIFKDDPMFAQTMKDAFTNIVNKDSGKFSIIAMLAAYCDNLLKGSMKLTDQDLDLQLQRCIEIFSNLIDKDMFADIHRTLLSKRLLNKRSVSTDAEKSVVGMMKMQCGAQFTGKLEGMLNDFNLATDMQNDYDAYFKEWRASDKGDASKNVAFMVTVLTAGFWPSPKVRNATYPTELLTLKNNFNDWYKNKFNLRSLQWIISLGEVSMKVLLHKRDYEITVTTIQAIVLAVLGDTSRDFTFEEIKELSGLDDVEALKRVLHSLSCQKFKILLKKPDSRVVLPSDSFRTNREFKNPLKKFRIPMATLDDSAEGSNSKNLNEERGTIVDACIVRIMKARKVLSHTQLQFEVLRQISTFQPDPKFIKQHIESLIEREYLARDETDNKSYKYLP